MAEAKQTTIRFSEDMYRRLEAAGEVTGLPINSIVVVACLEWLDAHQPERAHEFPWGLTRKVPGYPPVVTRRGYPFDRLTADAKKVLRMAEEEAKRADRGYIGDEHLLLGLLELDEGRAGTVLRSLGVEVDAARAQLDQALASRKQPVVAELNATTLEVRKIVEASFGEAHRARQERVGTEHILLGLLSEKDTVSSEVLKKLGVTPERLRAELERLEGEQPASA